MFVARGAEMVVMAIAMTSKNEQLAKREIDDESALSNCRCRYM